jgi:hypothetical protein
VTAPPRNGLVRYTTRMKARQHCTPLIISNGHCSALRRVPLDQRKVDEGWLQTLLFEYPQLIPVEDIEPVFARLLPLARELPTPAGPVDLVYISPAGYITFVETKLWRNPEARRQVVAQIVDYAAAVSRWSYEDLTNAVRRAKCQSVSREESLYAAVGGQTELEEAEFIDTVARNLAAGRLLLLIAGDGIHEAVEQLAGALSKSPHLGFSLGLVEIALFTPPGDETTMIVQPRLLARTREIVRAIVEVRRGADLVDVAIVLPVPDEAGGAGVRRKLTEEVFLEKLAGTTSTQIASEFRVFLSEAESIGIEPTARDASMTLFWDEPMTGQRFTFGYVTWKNGVIETGFVRHFLERAGLDPDIGLSYLEEIARLLPGAELRERTLKRGGRPVEIWIGSRQIIFSDLLPHKKEWLEAIESAMGRIKEALSERES